MRLGEAAEFLGILEGRGEWLVNEYGEPGLQERACEWQVVFAVAGGHHYRIHLPEHLLGALAEQFELSAFKDLLVLFGVVAADGHHLDVLEFVRQVGDESVEGLRECHGVGVFRAHDADSEH